MRHILVYHYFGIDTEAVWLAATRDLPTLRIQVGNIISSLGNEEKNPK